MTESPALVLSLKRALSYGWFMSTLSSKPQAFETWLGAVDGLLKSGLAHSLKGLWCAVLIPTGVIKVGVYGGGMEVF